MYWITLLLLGVLWGNIEEVSAKSNKTDNTYHTNNIKTLKKIATTICLACTL